MQSRIYRFEIRRALVNAVFEAVDSATGEAVVLYEWTPDASARDAARQRLEDLLPSLQAEVFTADASLYLAAPTREAGAALLRQLQQHELFTGAWENAAAQLPAPAPPPATIPREPVPYQPLQQATGMPEVLPPKKQSGSGCLFAFAGLLLFGVVWGMSNNFPLALLVLVVVWIVWRANWKSDARKTARRR